MHNNYIKQLAIKTFQEPPMREYRKTKGRHFHFRSFCVGVAASTMVLLIL